MDYPRPAPPHEGVNNEDETHKKEKRQGHASHDNEKKAQESGYRKVEATMPTRDGLGGRGGFGGAGMVVQPSGKGFTV